ncbi:MAG: hypothetical protein LCH95_01950 [Proteobacteria bacterium]|nr:hypothetical protein [Pseudomonadota bacterium]
MKTKQPRRGAVTKPPKPDRKANLSFKTTPILKRRIDAEAVRHARTIAQECEHRLELSFHRQDLLTETMTMAFGRQSAAILQFLGYGMRRLSGFGREDGLSKDDTSWLENPIAFAGVEFLFMDVLSLFAPVHEETPEINMGKAEHRAYGVQACLETFRLLEHSEDERWKQLRQTLRPLLKNAKREVYVEVEDDTV